MEKQIKLQSLDEIRQCLNDASSMWGENTIDDVFYDSSDEVTVDYGVQ